MYCVSVNTVSRDGWSPSGKEAMYLTASLNSNHAIIFTFRLIHLGKVLTILSLYLWIILYHYYSFVRMALTLDNL